MHCCVLLLLLSSILPLCTGSTLIFLRQTMSLGNTVLQLFWCNYSWCVYCYVLRFIIIIIIMSLVTGLFFLAILLNQQWSPPLRLHASHCSTFCVMCDVPSTAVFCSESIECDYYYGYYYYYYYYVSCHKPILPDNYLEPSVIPTAQASSFTLQYFLYYVWCSKYSCLL
jgi:hypothetical protein